MCSITKKLTNNVGFFFVDTQLNKDCLAYLLKICTRQQNKRIEIDGQYKKQDKNQKGRKL